MQNPLDMLIFAKVVQLHSFSAAAQRLGISRSAASKHVSRLEQALGVRLLNRTTRSLSLTEAGVSVYEHCARIAAEVEASELSVMPFARKPQGVLRVSAPGAFGRLHLVPTIPDYLRQQPAITVDLAMNDRIVDLIEERFDLAISSSPVPGANLTARKLAPIRWVVCASPKYLTAAGQPRDLMDLERHNCIYYSSAVVRGDVWNFTHEGRKLAIRVSGSFRANNSEAVRDAALQGIGIALLPTFAVWESFRSGELVRLFPDSFPEGTFGSALTAYFIADRRLAPKIRTFLDFLLERFGGTPYWDSVLSAAGDANAH